VCAGPPPAGRARLRGRRACSRTCPFGADSDHRAQSARRWQPARVAAVLRSIRIALPGPHLAPNWVICAGLKTGVEGGGSVFVFRRWVQFFTWRRHSMPRLGLGNDGDEEAGLVLRSPVQGPSGFRAFLVGGRELPGERVARPEPAPGDDQPECLRLLEEGGRRAESYVNRDDLAWGQRLRLAEGRYGVERPGAVFVEGAQRGFQPAGGDRGRIRRNLRRGCRCVRAISPRRRTGQRRRRRVLPPRAAGSSARSFRCRLGWVIQSRRPASACRR
jgi:hypothetical protein